MELTLNLIWLALAIAGLILWARFCWWPRNARGAALRQLHAVVYSLAILFPVISLTDDLNAQPADFEDPAPARQIIQAGDNGHGTSSAFPVSLLPATLSHAGNHVAADSVVGMVDPVTIRAFRILLVQSHPGRAPPVVL
jgi:hypothetical protein